MESIIAFPSCRADYVRDKKRIVFTFQGYIKLDDAKAMYREVLAFMKKNPVQAFLNDMRELKGTFTNLTAWLFTEMTEVIEWGLRYDAMVLNHDVFTNFASQDFKNKTKMLQVQIFSTITSAEEWLDDRMVMG